MIRFQLYHFFNFNKIIVLTKYQDRNTCKNIVQISRNNMNNALYKFYGVYSIVFRILCARCTENIN